MNHTTGLCSSYSTQLYTTFYTAYTTDLQCMLILCNIFVELEHFILFTILISTTTSSISG